MCDNAILRSLNVHCIIYRHWVETNVEKERQGGGKNAKINCGTVGL